MSLIQSLETQARVIWSITARVNLRMHRTSPFGILSGLLEPIALILLMTLVFTTIRMRVPGMGDYLMIFIATGVVPIYAFKRGESAAQRVAISMRGVLCFPTVRPMDLIISGVLTYFITMVALFAGITLFFKLFYRMEEPQNFALALIPVVGNAIIAFGIASVNLLIKTWFPYWGTIWSILTAPLAIVSGLFYTADVMPQKVLDILYWNPFFHSTDLCRSYYFPEYTSTFFDPYYYYGWVLGSLLVGLFVERYFRYRLKSNVRQ